MDTIIGIDLGTSTTEAAIYKDGKVQMVLNFDKQEITPSALGIDNNGNWIFGRRAMSQLLLSPENTAIEVKRKIGTQEKIFIGGKPYTAVDLSAKLLEYVRNYASEYLDEDITHAVISVPAYFNDIQRQETIKAGIQAGFEVERILNEPTAAALSYGLEHMDEESHILVYDLGGGTFDVTLLEMFDGVLEVKASAGDNQLGGKDFDEKIMNTLLKNFEKKNGVNLRNDKHAMVSLKDEAEKCKKALSTDESYTVLIPAITTIGGKPVELNETITRKEFEKLVRPLIDRTHGPIDVVLADSGISAASLDRIILVGGSTRMPIVAQDIQEYLGMVPDKAVNPDFAVSEGAAIQAAILSGAIDPMESLVMTDVNPYSLGTRCLNGMDDDYFSVIIPRNVTIPTTQRKRYYTAGNYQTLVKIDVYQGEKSKASLNHFLADYDLSGIPPRPAGEESIDIEFTYNVNGILEVRSIIVSTGKEAGITIDMHGQDSAPTLTDEDSWKQSSIADDYRAIIRRAERTIARLEEDEDADTAYLDRIRSSLSQLKAAIADEDNEMADELENTLVGILHFMEEN